MSPHPQHTQSPTVLSARVVELKVNAPAQGLIDSFRPQDFPPLEVLLQELLLGNTILLLVDFRKVARKDVRRHKQAAHLFVLDACTHIPAASTLVTHAAQKHTVVNRPCQFSSTVRDVRALPHHGGYSHGNTRLICS